MRCTPILVCGVRGLGWNRRRRTDKRIQVADEEEKEREREEDRGKRKIQ